MPVSDNKLWMQIERRNWLQWLVAFVVILALAVTVYLLYDRMSRDLAMATPASFRMDSGYYTGIGLVGLVCVFILYTVLKQLELRGLRRTLESEEVELERLRTRLAEITHLFEVAAKINLRLPVESILNIMVRRVVDALKAQQASVMLYDPETQLLETRAYYGVEGEYTSLGRLRLGEGIAGRVAAERLAMILSDTPPMPELKQYYKPHRHITSALSIPLVVEEKCVGVLNINRINHPHLFTESQCEIVRLFAEHIGAVIQRAFEMDRLADEARNLEVANAKLTEMNRLKEIFLSTASHELKTPLTSVIGYAELLSEHEERLAPTQRREFTRRLRSEAENLLGLIEDILDLTRLETGKVTLRRSAVRLNEVVKAAVETTRSLAAKHHIRILEDYDTDQEPVAADEIKIRQTVVNLIVNAIKYSPEEGEVRVRTRTEGPWAAIEITDQGPGVSAEESAQIFTLFGQAVRPSTKSISGLGIGLHLVKRIVELHGGEVGVDPAQQHGSRFWIRLPREAARTDASPADPAQAA